MWLDLSLFSSEFRVVVGWFWSEMERDFLGLSSKEPLTVVKEEIDNDGAQDSGNFFPIPFWCALMNF